MQPDNSPDLLVDGSITARRTSGLLTLVAAVFLASNCFLNSPGEFSSRHYEDHSLLKPIVGLLALGGQCPTLRGVEIRNLVFHSGAALLVLIAGIRLVTAGRRPRVSGESLIDLRRRAASPFFWWCTLLLVSVISSWYSHAPEVCKGQTILRFLQLAWWWPLAALLTPRDARRLSGWVLAILGLLATLAVWYHVQRPAPRLQYPIGNELFLAACLLPGLFIAFGLVIGWLHGCLTKRREPADAMTDHPVQVTAPAPQLRMLHILAVVLVSLFIIAALYFTRSRSGAVGLTAGLCMVVVLVVRRKTRLWVVLAVAVLAIGGALMVQSLRTGGVMGERAHSIRARLNHEWPYALTLFFQKPVAGWGDGGYAMLAGQFARVEQLDDPGVLSFDTWSWVGHAHNEFLELLADLGFVGAFAFAAALFVTIRQALRYCDRSRGDPSAGRCRWLVIGLTAALVALVIEECGDVALRKPGLPPIFLTVWALVWAMVRSSRDVVTTEQDDAQRLSISTMRLTGAAVCVGALVLGWFGVQDWRGARAVYDAVKIHMPAGQYDEAIRDADLAVVHTLDPERNLISRVHAVRVRSLKFNQLCSDVDSRVTDDDIAFAEDALADLAQLDKAAPRFLMSARFRADLTGNLASVFRGRGQPLIERDYRTQWQQAWIQHREDEPFRIDVVEALWVVLPEARSVDRLLWLRALLRNREIDGRFLGLFQNAAAREDFRGALGDLYNIAMQDSARQPAEWVDKLSPETCRVVALEQALFGGQPSEAAKTAAGAEALYAKAGPRLFVAHAAAIHEMVRYRLDADPAAAPEENLHLLARAYAILAREVGDDEPMSGDLGQTRLRVLLAAGRELEAETQARFLYPDNDMPVDRRIAEGYLSLVAQFAERPLHSDDALRWARRAVELAPILAEAHAMIVGIHLRRGDDASALEAAVALLESAKDAETARQYLATLETHYPGSGMWPKLLLRYPDLLPPPQAGPPPPEESEPRP
ncbi:MAG: O-antigen ligase family protein [Planctomycetota bacterium]